MHHTQQHELEHQFEHATIEIKGRSSSKGIGFNIRNT
jgi:hypothetical protein